MVWYRIIAVIKSSGPQWLFRVEGFAIRRQKGGLEMDEE
jgi:hypothetical protein